MISVLQVFYNPDIFTDADYAAEDEIANEDAQCHSRSAIVRIGSHSDSVTVSAAVVSPEDLALLPRALVGLSSSRDTTACVLASSLYKKKLEEQIAVKLEKEEVCKSG